MILKNKIKSEVDKTIKYIFEINNQIVEFSYIDNNTGKDIICVPCQTMCNMSCAFCHLTDHVGKIRLTNLDSDEMVEGVIMIIEDLKLSTERDLLISFMGCGEPLDNPEQVISSLILLSGERPNIRFGLATMLPKSRWGSFFGFIDNVVAHKINLKVHLSLHFVNDELRKTWMPSAWDIESSLSALKIYQNVTKNPIEVHYTIMEGINDSDEDIQRLHELVPLDCTIKFMMYSERDGIDAQKSPKDTINKHIEYLTGLGHIAEYYEPPGNDIGSSCGQFLTQLKEEYAKGNII
jgi:23S rRNA (adenine2503-C2)-methyltransferase